MKIAVTGSRGTTGAPLVEELHAQERSLRQLLQVMRLSLIQHSLEDLSQVTQKKF